MGFTGKFSRQWRFTACPVRWSFRWLYPDRNHDFAETRADGGMAPPFRFFGSPFLRVILWRKACVSNCLWSCRVVG